MSSLTSSLKSKFYCRTYIRTCEMSVRVGGSSMLAVNWGCSPHYKQRGEVGLWRSRSSMRRRKCREDPTRKLKDRHRFGVAARCDATAVALSGPLTLPDSPPRLVGLGSVSLPLNKPVCRFRRRPLWSALRTQVGHRGRCRIFECEVAALVFLGVAVGVARYLA